MRHTEEPASTEEPTADLATLGVFSALDLLGLPSSVDARSAQGWVGTLKSIWEHQFGRPPTALNEDLAALDTFFNPTRKGEAVRTALSKVVAGRLDPENLPVSESDDRFVLAAGSNRFLVTPEGRVLLECLIDGLRRRQGPWIECDPAVASDGVRLLMLRYRQMSRHRLRDVIALLSGDSKQTMRPAVAGLLLVLLLNRNTAAGRPLRKYPDDRDTARSLTAALADITAAYARTFGGEADAVNAVDVYRGWAYGELARRLGDTMVNTDAELYLTDEDHALRRLTDDIAGRPSDIRSRVPSAVDAALAAYSRQLPIISALGVAFERPSHTRRIAESVRLASQITRE
jgi:hypothetical protein